MTFETLTTLATNCSIIIVTFFLIINYKTKTMGILFISITVAVVIVVFILITVKRRKKTIQNVTPDDHDVVREETGKKKGIYD